VRNKIAEDDQMTLDIQLISTLTKVYLPCQVKYYLYWSFALEKSTAFEFEKRHDYS
jgi:hypothetical protein